jgi:hypothetical protein
MNGGAGIPAAGGTVSVWCESQDVADIASEAQLMFVQVGGYS